MSFFNLYPYTDFHELNLDMLLTMVKSLAEEMKIFIATSTVKYADPFQWNITKQYEKNTIVFDTDSEIAYLSVAPVHAGISISNTDYWTPVFDLSAMFMDFNGNLTNNDEAQNVTSSAAYSAGDWLIWKNELYKVILPINIGDGFAVDTNIEKKTVEEFINDNIADISAIVAAAIEALRTEYISKYDTLTDLLAADIPTGSYAETLGYSSIYDNGGTKYRIYDNDTEPVPVGAYYETMSNGNLAVVVTRNNTPEMFGCVGDGVTDDSIKMNECFSHSDVVTFSPDKTYMIDAIPSNHPIELHSNMKVVGLGSTVKCITNDSTSYYIFLLHQLHDVEIEGVNFVGERDSHTGTTGEWGEGLRMRTCENIYVHDCTFKDFWGDGLIMEVAGGPNKNIIVENCTFKRCRRNGISVIWVDGARITNCTFDTIYGTAPQQGIDIEPNIATQYARNLFISDCHFLNCAGGGLGVRNSYSPTIYINNCDIVYDGADADAYTAGSAITIDTDVSHTGGEVVISDIYIEYTRFSAIVITNHSPSNYLLTLRNITFNRRLRNLTNVNADTVLYITSTTDVGNMIVDNIIVKNVEALRSFCYCAAGTIKDSIFKNIREPYEIEVLQGMPMNNSSEFENCTFSKYFPDTNGTMDSSYVTNRIFYRANSARTLTIDPAVPYGRYSVTNVGTGTLTVTITGVATFTVATGTAMSFDYSSYGAFKL